jgi:hypothetical protein
MIELDRRALKRPAPAWGRLIDYMEQMAARNGELDVFHQQMRDSQADIDGEGGFLMSVLILMNSKTVIEREPVDLTRLNDARRRNRKPPLLDYSKVVMNLTRVQRNRVGSTGTGTTHSHGLRMWAGHMKVRKTGVYYWSPHFRGDPAKGFDPRPTREVRP